jgi:hypothetical protein
MRSLIISFSLRISSGSAVNGCSALSYAVGNKPPLGTPLAIDLFVVSDTIHVWSGPGTLLVCPPVFLGLFFLHFPPSGLAGSL